MVITSGGNRYVLGTRQNPLPRTLLLVAYSLDMNDEGRGVPCASCYMCTTLHIDELSYNENSGSTFGTCQSACLYLVLLILNVIRILGSPLYGEQVYCRNGIGQQSSTLSKLPPLRRQLPSTQLPLALGRPWESSTLAVRRIEFLEKENWEIASRSEELQALSALSRYQQLHPCLGNQTY